MWIAVVLSDNVMNNFRFADDIAGLQLLLTVVQMVVDGIDRESSRLSRE